MSSDTPPAPEDWESPTFSSCDDVNELCPVEATIYGDYFNTGACIFFTSMYGILLVAQIYLCWRARTWSFGVWLGIGTISECMGYAARIAMSYNPWVYDTFVIQLVMLILGPTFVAAAISITFKYLALWYGPRWSLLKPRLYPWVFVGTDFFSIAIQAVGGVMSAIATGNNDNDLLDTGSDLLVAGVVFQAANMLFCGGLMLIFFFRRWRSFKNGQDRLGSSNGADSSDVSVSREAKQDTVVYSKADEKRANIFVGAITFAYIAIIIRCIYRIPEMQTGWASDLMQNETLFLIFDGTMILLSVLALCIFHPAFFFPFMGTCKGEERYRNSHDSTSPEEYEMENAPNSVLG